MFFFHFITYHLYLLQLENYELVRYWRLISKKGLFHPKEPLRKKLVWTAKAKFLFAGATLLHFFLTLYLVYTVLFFATPYPPPLGVMWFVSRLLFLMLLYPLFYMPVKILHSHLRYNLYHFLRNFITILGNLGIFFRLLIVSIVLKSKTCYSVSLQI